MRVDSPGLRRLQAVLWLLVALLPALSGASCATHAEIRREMVNEVRTGNYTRALERLDGLAQKSSSKDLVMDLMDRALLLHQLGRYVESNQVIEKIKDALDKLYGTKWADELAAIAWNDAQRAFEGEEFEKVMIHLIATFNYLHMNELESAGVEARQINHRLQVYVDHLARNKVNTRYVQDPFAQYLAGIIHESFGDDNSAFRSYEDALHGYDTVGAIVGLAPPEPLEAALVRTATRLGWTEKQELYTQRFGTPAAASPAHWKNKARLVVINGIGMVARKRQEKWIIPDPEFDTIVVTYPVFERSPFLGRYSEVTVAGRRSRPPVGQDLSSLAISMLDEKNDQVKGRAVAKALIRYAAKKVTKAVAKNAGEGAGAFALLANVALNIYDMVEPADTRSWMTLPDHYRITELAVAPGEQDVVVVHHGAGMRDEQRFLLPLKAGETRILVTRSREPGSSRADDPARPVDTRVPGRVTTPDPVALRLSYLR